MRKISCILFSFILFCAAQSVAASDITPFKIRVSIASDTITLTPISGCAWQTVSIPMGKTGTTPLIVSSKEATRSWESDLSSEVAYRFFLLVEKDNLEAASISGTTWLSLGATYKGVNECILTESSVDVPGL